MKRWLLLIPLLFLPVSAHAVASAYVQSVYCKGTGTSVVCPALGTTVAGNKLILALGIAVASAATPTIADTQLNTYTPVVTAASTGCSQAGAGMTVFYYETGVIGAGAANIATITRGTTDPVEAFLFEYSGLATSAIDQFACAGNSTGTTLASGATPTNSVSNVACIGFTFNNRAYTGIGAGGYTQRASDVNNYYVISGDQNRSSVSACPSFAPTVATNAAWISAIVSFKDTGQPATAAPRRRPIVF